MSNVITPAYYNDLDLTLAEIERVLAEGASDRRAAAHHPVVASIDTDGRPSQRVMILREADWPQKRLRFHTDSRSAKIAQICARHEMSVLIYDEPAKLQLRLTGTAWAHDGEDADQAWSESTPFARRCYMAEGAPGRISDIPTSGLPDWIEGVKPREDQLGDARTNFAVMLFAFDRIDWLCLANTGHRRAHFSCDSGSWNGKWVVP